MAYKEKFVNWDTGVPIPLSLATGSIFDVAGTNHSIGLVPDPGAVVHSPPYYLGDNGLWTLVPVQVLPRSTTTTYTGNTDITATIPIDNTIPQITEGIEVLTATLTPTRATSTLRIRASGVYNNNTVSGISVFALFKDSDVNAIRSIFIHEYFADHAQLFYTEVAISPATTSLVTIRLRVGTLAPQVIRPNRSVTNDLGGGSQAWSLTVEELLV